MMHGVTPGNKCNQCRLCALCALCGLSNRIEAIEDCFIGLEFKREFGEAFADGFVREEVEDSRLFGELDSAVAAFGGVDAEEIFTGVDIVVGIRVDVAAGSTCDVAEQPGGDDRGGGIDGCPTILRL